MYARRQYDVFLDLIRFRPWFFISRTVSGRRTWMAYVGINIQFLSPFISGLSVLPIWKRNAKYKAL